MGHWYINQGSNRNLLTNLSGGPLQYQLDVYVVARFRFRFSPGALNWTIGETQRWKRRFFELVYNTWSERWTLLSDISCPIVDADRLRIPLPSARVRVHAVDVDAPSVPLPARQRIYLINVYRPAPGEARSRQHASGLLVGLATVADAANGELPAGTAGALTDGAALYEDSLELGPPSPIDRQVAAMHEFGHLLGLQHPNDMGEGCIGDRGADICYGRPGSPESLSVMGRGQEIRREEYSVFAYIISRLVPNIAAPAGISRALGVTYRLFWMVAGRRNVQCDSAPLDMLGYARPPGPLGSRHSLWDAQPPGPLGVA